jgi:signal peptidase II
MRKLNSLQGKWWHNPVFFLIALAVVVADQFSKTWIRSNLAIGQSLPESGFFHLTHIQNTGAAFGVFQNHVFPLAIVSFVGVAVILVYTFYVCRRYPFLNNMISKAALATILGGAVGNLIDRLNLGYVTDFIGVGSFPLFNVADSSLTVGSFVFAGSLFYLLYSEKQERRGDKVASEES